MAAGCGSDKVPTYPVTGKVSFADGSPLQGGTIEFRSKTPALKNLNATGRIDDSGNFKLGTFADGDGAVEGEHDVIIVPKPSLESRPGVAAPPDPLDKKYRDYATSDLKATVKAQSSNPIEFQVTPPTVEKK